MKYYLHCLKNYANFSGRARRREFWFFILFHFLILFVLVLTTGIFEVNSGADADTVSSQLVLYLVYFAATIIPLLAATARRLHDMGKSGTWVFIYFVPLVGGIILLIMLFTDSQTGMNKWGMNPKEEGMDEIDEIGNYLAP